MAGTDMHRAVDTPDLLSGNRASGVEHLHLLRNMGFCCALVACVLFICVTVRFTVHLGVFVFPAAPIILIFTMFLLMMAADLNDFLIGPLGLICLKTVISIGTVGSAFLFFSQLGLAGAILIALFVAASVLLWGASLAYYDRTELLLTTAVSFITAGLVLLTVLNLEIAVAFMICIGFAVLSTLCAFITLANPILQNTHIELELSRSRGTAGRGNSFTIISIGMTVGAAVIMGCSLQLDSLLIAVGVGAAIALSGLATAVFRARFKQAYEDLARRFIAVFATCSILPYPFVSSELQLVCVCVLCVTATVNCIILIDAIAETARLKRVSPFWLIGNEGACFMVGTLIALILFWLLLWRGSALSATIGCVSATIIFTALQIFIEGQSYPYFEALPEDDATDYLEHQNYYEGELSAGGGAAWRERMDAVASEHRLSPRQQEIMRLLLKGRDVKYIMSRFGISQATAKTHVYNLYKKLGVHSRHELLDLVEQTPLGN